MNSPTLYILCGLPFSGKTVLTKKIADNLGFARVGVDEIVFSRGYDWTKTIPEKELEDILDESYEQALIFLQSGKSVVYDWANQEKEKRDKLRNLAKQHDFSSKVIHTDVALSVIRKRWQENKRTKKRFDISESVLQYAIDTYELPLKNEDVITYTPGMKFDMWILKNFNVMIVRLLKRKIFKNRNTHIQNMNAFNAL